MLYGAAFLRDIFSKPLDEDGESIRDHAMSICGDYIQKHSQKFISSACKAYKQIGRELAYDYAEIKDMEEPELLDVRHDNGVYIIKVGVPYILDLWEKEDFLGHINAYAEAVLSLKLEEENTALSAREMKIIELQNAEDYFDMHV